MEFGMSSQAFLFLIGIGASLFAGFILGAIATLYINIKENKRLEQELDTFQNLYFNELYKWINIYDDDNYEAY